MSMGKRLDIHEKKENSELKIKVSRVRCEGLRGNVSKKIRDGVDEGWCSFDVTILGSVGTDNSHIERCPKCDSSTVYEKGYI